MPQKEKWDFTKELSFLLKEDEKKVSLRLNHSTDIIGFKREGEEITITVG